MEPQQIRQREYWGLGTLLLAIIYLLIAIGYWLVAGGSFTGVVLAAVLGGTGLFIIATLPDSDSSDLEGY